MRPILASGRAENEGPSACLGGGHGAGGGCPGDSVTDWTRAQQSRGGGEGWGRREGPPSMARSWRGEKEPGLLSTQGSHPVPGPASRLQTLLGFLRVLERQKLLSPPSREGPLSGHVHPGLGLGGWGRSRSLPWGPEGQGLIRLRPAHPGPRRRPGRTPGRKGAGGSPEDAGRSVGGAPRGPRPGGRADARECPAATRAEGRRRGRWRLPRPLRFSLLLSTVNEGWF